ncbi:MAG: hypothetical protein ACP5E2_02785 [Terracidiphilus sp.]
MNWEHDLAGEDQEIKQALRHFKTSMDAWSDAAMSRPRMVAKASVRHIWRRAASWAMGCLLAVGSLAVGVHAIYHGQQMAKLPAQRTVQQAAVEQVASGQETALPASAQTAETAPVPETKAVKGDVSAQDKDLLASVDRALSRTVPEAMEPLAQLMDDNEAQ